MSDIPRRGVLFGFAALLVAALTPGAAEAQGRGWGPDGLGPPGQRRRANRGLPPGQRRRLARGRSLPPGQLRRLQRGW